MKTVLRISFPKKLWACVGRVVLSNTELVRFGGKRGVWSAGCGKCGVWRMSCVENAECGKCMENFNFPFQFQFAISNAEKQCVNNKRKRKKRNESLHFKMRRAGMVISVVV